LGFLVQFCGGHGIDPTKIDGLIPRFQDELPSRDVSKILLVSGMLVQNAPDSEGLVDSLTYVLSDEEARNRLQAIQDLGKLGPRAAPAVPKLVELLAEYLKPAPITPGTNPPYMVPGWSPGSAPDLRVEIIRTLGKIGPAAKAALPVLRDALEGPYPGKGMDPEVEKAIAQIEGTPPDDQQ
jgi:HEAT repeat protein